MNRYSMLLSFFPIVAVPVSAQIQDATLAAFGLRDAAVVSLQLPDPSVGGRASFTVDVAIGGRQRTLSLRPATLRAAGYRLLVDDGVAMRSVGVGEDLSYSGSVVGLANSEVAATLYLGQLHAWIDDGSGVTWAIEPLTKRVPGAAPERHLVYAAHDVLPTPGTCGVTASMRPFGSGSSQNGAVGTGTSSGPTAIQDCQIALDCDFDYYQQNGASVPSVQAAATALIAGVDLIYRRDCSICYTITAIVVRSTATYTSGTNVGCQMGNPGLLQEMQSRWNANQVGVQRDVAHLLSGKGTANGTIGCAFNGVICSGASAYGVSRVVNSSFVSNVALVAHELGHNWDADHCDGNASCQIMCSSQNCSTSLTAFGASALAQIAAHRDSRPCLNNCSGCSNVAEYSYFGSGCAGSASGSGPGCVQRDFGPPAGVFFNQGFETAMPASTGGQGRYLTSVDLYVRARSGSETLTVRIRARDAVGGEPTTELGQGTMTVGSSTAIYNAALTSPVYLPAGTDFYVTFDNPGPNLITPIPSSGSQTAWWAQLGGSWFQQAPSAWAYRLNCIGAGAAPVLTNSGLPSLGSSFDVELRFARANTPAALLWGSSAANVDLAVLGAGGCSLYVGGIFTTEPRTTDANGDASWTIAVPNDTGLCGFGLFQQVAIVDLGANALSVVTTRRGMPVFGN